MIQDRWSALSAEAKVRWHGTALCGPLYLLHYVMHSTWYIEDAAISFSFARHAAMGEGLVAYIGGERVEGFSNPSWTLLLAAIDFVGINPFIAAKLLGALFGLMCLPLALLWAERVMGRNAGLWPVLAPLVLATSPQFVVWNASGLENSIFNLFLALGALLLLGEVDEDRPFAWSGLAWFGLAITRPEAPLYVVVAAALAWAAIALVRGPRATFFWAARFALSFLGPFLVWHAWRYIYFAWEFPNTYYAKLNDEKFQPFGWAHRGWQYLRNFALVSTYGFLAPLFLLGQTGLDGWRGRLGRIVVVVTLLLLLPGLGWPFLLAEHVGWDLGWSEPLWSVSSRIGWLVAVCFLVVVIGLERPGSVARTLAWAMTIVTIFFALFSGGDWMEGYRWLAMASVPMAILLADAIQLVALRWGRWWVCLPLIATVLIANVVNATRLVSFPDTSMYSVYRRVKYVHHLMERLDLDHATIMDVDMGANMWWGNNHIVDMAGLVDVPMGHHEWEKPFVKEYVYRQRQPEFAHVHSHWENKTGLSRHAEWRRYIEVPGYPVSTRSRHVGNLVRRDLFVRPNWEGTARNVTFGKNAELVGWDLVVPRVAPGGGLELDVGLRRGQSRALNFRVWVFLAGQDRVVMSEIPPGYDWYLPRRWKRAEVVTNNVSVTLPDDLPPGEYDLGFVFVLSGDDGILSAADIPPGATVDEPVVARGEVRWKGVVAMVSPDEVLEDAMAHRSDVVSLANEGRCDEAVTAWRAARSPFARDDQWVQASLAQVASPVARCYANRAVERDDPELIVLAKRWDFEDQQVLQLARQLADKRQRAGEMALDAGDIEVAFWDWSAALRADPSRSWLRRRTEELRNERLFAKDK